MNIVWQSLNSGSTGRGAFVAYSWGAAISLGILTFVLGRYTTRHIGSLGHASLQPLQILGLSCVIAGLFLTCFFLLLRLARRAVDAHCQAGQFDALTGLPNRILFQDRAQKALQDACREEGLFAICFIDLDGFKQVNDSLGHGAGDELLCEIAKRLVGTVRLSDSIARMEVKDTQLGVARLGGDEFTLLLSGFSNALDVERVARRVLKALRETYEVAGHELSVTASLGIAIYPMDGDSVEQILKSADTAMYCAKELGRNNCKFFSASMNEASEKKLELEDRMRGALSRNELSVHYQPIRSAETGRVVAAEALVCWMDSELGPVSRADFIAVAEDVGLVEKIGYWVLQTAATQSRAWQAAGFQPVRMAVNVSGHQVRRPEFVEKVAQVLEQTGLSAEHLELELTETTFMRENDLIDAAFAALGKLGVGLALDEFGAGYSSLTYLRRFPITRVKIDRSFIAGMPNDAKNLAISSAIVSVAHHLSMSVVGEGVETEEQAQSLRELGCEEFQGPLFSQAVPADEFVRFLEQEKQQERQEAEQAKQAEPAELE